MKLAGDCFGLDSERKDTMLRVKRVLVPVDFSRISDLAVDYALAMAAREGVSMHLLHVIDIAAVARAYPAGLYEPPGLRARLIEEARKHLARIVAACQTANVAATIEVLVGRPASCITEEAVTAGCDLIVMGTHGRSGLAHLVLGSVAERVLRTAQCPVLTVRDSSRLADIMGTGAAKTRQTTVGA